jgi:hypothetical protein
LPTIGATGPKTDRSSFGRYRRAKVKAKEVALKYKYFWVVDPIHLLENSINKG